MDMLFIFLIIYERDTEHAYYIGLGLSNFARAVLNLCGIMLGFSQITVMPSKTAILPVNPTFLPGGSTIDGGCLILSKGVSLGRRVGHKLGFVFGPNQASVAGYVRGQYQLALCLHRGIGTDQNLSEAARWYLRAAEGGYVRAMYNVSLCFSLGRGFL
ncbi:F-box family protein [Artemisia annua]|uniref:F-box family protein n=1 Tax=Artemisia annua TaxID=35608 RepID=A0A2U1PZ92_ARTAN|nr:F-box family protein [Artemisia annua]